MVIQHVMPVIFAITLGAIDVLLSFGIKVKLFSRYSRSNLDYHQALETLNQRYSNHIEVFESPFTLDRTDSMIKTLKNYTEGLFTIMGIIRKRGFRRQLLDSDMIILMVEICSGVILLLIYSLIGIDVSITSRTEEW